ncbi:hypothetical protein [Streptomyces sp. NPDC001194]|uniref:hypothetical protein n=1 Tax=unclassified Streptomyces TaxID=2593676 RepID=UPI003678EFF9
MTQPDPSFALTRTGTAEVSRRKDFPSGFAKVVEESVRSPTTSTGLPDFFAAASACSLSVLGAASAAAADGAYADTTPKTIAMPSEVATA